MFNKKLHWDNLAPILRRDVGKRIRNIREELGMSQSDLAKASGRRQAYISEIENGKTEPTLLTLVQFSYAFNKPLDYLLPVKWRNISGDESEVSQIGLSSVEQDLIDAIRKTQSYEHKLIALYLIKSLIRYYEETYESGFSEET